VDALGHRRWMRFIITKSASPQASLQSIILIDFAFSKYSEQNRGSFGAVDCPGVFWPGSSRRDGL
jgi:hypothetical protein